MSKLMLVTGCDECPFNHDPDAATPGCEAPHEVVGDIILFDDARTPRTLPTWCPLRERPVLVSLQMLRIPKGPS